jgi:phospholipid-transporting ATPase
MNSHARSRVAVKRSTIEVMMNQCIYVQLVLQCVFCLIGGLIAGVWQHQHTEHTYLFVFQHPAVVGIQRFFTWLIIFSGFVPISLLVSLEVVKFAQGMFMGVDIGQ